MPHKIAFQSSLRDWISVSLLTRHSASLHAGLSTVAAARLRSASDIYLKACATHRVAGFRSGALHWISQRDGLGGVRSLAEVRIQEGEPLENALRRFKRKVQQEDIIKEVKRHSYYIKPGEKKRVKEALARKRSRKKARKEQD